MRYDALARENGELRGLKDALPPVADRWLAAEIVTDSHRQRIVVNRGTWNGVFKAQAVLDDKGVLGQTTHVGPFSAEVILITNPEHAIPVTIERTGLRTIAVGAGDESNSLGLPYLPGNADVKPGDQLVTSGLGGVFPAGYPVGRVTEVHRDAVQPLAQVRATPYADVDIDREVMLVWFREDHPAAPTAAATSDLKVGNKSFQPQPTPPPRPKAAAPAVQPETPTGAPPATNSTAPHAPNSSAGARKPTAPSGTVNPPPAPSSNRGTAPAPASAEAVPATKEAAPVEAPKNPTTEQPADAPRNP
jgi:rod shape-determining protein MreC